MKRWLFLVSLSIAINLCMVGSSHAVNYWVRGEAVLQGNAIPATCGNAGKTFSAVVHVTTQAACNAHPTCTAAKVTAVNNWIAQFNQRNLPQCVGFVQQSTNHCDYHC